MSQDIAELFQSFNQTAKRSERTKWWKNLDASITAQDTNDKPTEIAGDDENTLTGIINAFTELSRVKKPQSSTNTNRSIILFQCLHSIDLASNQKIKKFAKSVCGAADTFKNNEECMEILVSWTEKEKRNNKLLPSICSMGRIFIDNALNNDFNFVLNRASTKHCQTLLDRMTFNDLKYYLDSNKIKAIGYRINGCGDWYLQNILFAWISSYFQHFKSCSNKISYLKKIKSQFYKGLFTDVKNVSDATISLATIKKLIKNKVNDKLFDSEHTESKHIDIADILLDYNDQIYPENSVWTLQHIGKAWIYNGSGRGTDELRHFDGNFKVHIGTKLLYVTCDIDLSFEASVLWDGVSRFESDANSMQCCIHFIEFESKNDVVIYDGSYDNISHIKFEFESDNDADFATLVQDIVSILPQTATVNMIARRKKKAKKKSKKVTQTYKSYQSKRRNVDKKEGNKSKHIISSEKKANKEILAESHIIWSERERIKSCDIDLSVEYPECGEYIRYRCKAVGDKWQYGQVIFAQDNNLEIEVIGNAINVRHKTVLIDLTEIECEIMSEKEIGKLLPIIVASDNTVELEEVDETGKHEMDEKEKEKEEMGENNDEEIPETDYDIKLDEIDILNENEIIDNMDDNEEHMDVDKITDKNEGETKNSNVHIIEHNVNHQKNENMNEIRGKNEENDENEENEDKYQQLQFDDELAQTIENTRIEEGESEEKQQEINNKHNEFQETEENEENLPDNKQQQNAIILVPDSDGSQQQQYNDDNINLNNDAFMCRPLRSPQKPLNPYKTPQNSRSIPMIKISKRSKRSTTKRQTTVKWRKRPPLTLQNAQNKNKNKDKENGSDDDLINDDSHDIQEHNLNAMDIDNNNNNIMNVKKSKPKPKALQEIADNVNQQKKMKYNQYDRKSKKRKEYENRDENGMNIAPQKKRRRTVVTEEKETQTEGAKHLDINKIAQQISSRFKVLFEGLFRDKLQELKMENDAFRQFLREKVSETNEIQNEYNTKMKQVQSEIFNKFRKDILKKWKDDVMDVCEQLDEHGANIRNNNAANQQQRNNATATDDIVRQISSLLNTYNQN